MTQPSPAAAQLLNLADRAERHQLTGDEAARLRNGINTLYAELGNLRLATAGADHVSAAWARKLREQRERAEQAESRLYALKEAHVALAGKAGKDQATVRRVRDECSRIEAAVQDHPTAPELAGGYLACLRHIRAALDEHQEQ
ncbi:hypothetical protein [Streptomyces sp. NPDC001774]